MNERGLKRQEQQQQQQQAGEDEKEFPYFYMSILFLSSFTAAIPLTGLFPYLAYMVVDLNGADDVDEAGFVSGYVASAFMLGRMLTSFYWGHVADQCGRKPVYYLGSACIIIFSLMFGCSVNIAMAVLSRLMLGLLNPMSALSKTVITEICIKEHQPFAMSLATGSWSLGLVVGPFVGGYLSRPSQQYPSVFGGFWLFEQFPYLLPNIVTALLAAISLVLTYVYLPETLKPPRRKKKTPTFVIEEEEDDDDEEGVEKEVQAEAQRPDGLFGGQGGAMDKTTTYTTNRINEDGISSDVLDETDVSSVDSDTDRDTVVVIDFASIRDNKKVTVSNKRNNNNDDDNSNKNNSMSNFQTKRKSGWRAQSDINRDKLDETNCMYDDDCYYDQPVALPTLFATVFSCFGQTAEETTTEKKEEKESLWEAAKTLIKMPKVQISCAAYFMISLTAIIFDEVFPLWAQSSIEAGGLALSPAAIGEVGSISGLPILLTTFVLFPIVVKKFGAIACFRYGQLLSAVCSFCAVFVPLWGSDMSKNSIKACLVVISAGSRGCAVVAFSSVFLLINNSVNQKYRGSVNGMSMTIAGLAKFIGPLFGPILFAWSINNGTDGPPFNYTFVFSICLLIGMGTCFLRFPASSSEDGDTSPAGGSTTVVSEREQQQQRANRNGETSTIATTNPLQQCKRTTSGGSKKGTKLNGTYVQLGTAASSSCRGLDADSNNRDIRDDDDDDGDGDVYGASFRTKFAEHSNEKEDGDIELGGINNKNVNGNNSSMSKGKMFLKQKLLKKEKGGGAYSGLSTADSSNTDGF